MPHPSSKNTEHKPQQWLAVFGGERDGEIKQRIKIQDNEAAEYKNDSADQPSRGGATNSVVFNGVGNGHF